MKVEDHPFIESIPERDKADVLSQIELLRFASGEQVFAENSAPDAMYLILEGRVVFTKERENGDEQAVSESGEGAFFGEVGIFTGDPRSLGARALTPIELGRVPKATVDQIIRVAPGPINKVLESVILHLKGTTTHYLDELVRNEKLALVGTMISSLLHDFKNPFAIISIGAHLVREKHLDDPKTVHICDNIAAQIDRMVQMANDISAFSRGEERIEYASIHTADLVASFRELNAPFFELEGVEVVTEVERFTFQADRVKLLRVLQNLVANAIEAIQSAEPAQGSVRIGVHREAGCCCIEVADTGPGIPRTIRATFFEPFVSYGKTNGTGLGSAIVKSIVKAHAGTIDFETSTKGTRFTIRLPMDGRAPAHA